MVAVVVVRGLLSTGARSRCLESRTRVPASTHTNQGSTPSSRPRSQTPLSSSRSSQGVVLSSSVFPLDVRVCPRSVFLEASRPAGRLRVFVRGESSQEHRETQRTTEMDKRARHRHRNRTERKVNETSRAERNKEGEGGHAHRIMLTPETRMATDEGPRRLQSRLEVVTNIPDASASPCAAARSSRDL
jgi:hypothetical protein